MPIRILPQELASAIAAGEVIERPASVVRELLENSLDAGARRVAVSLEGAGLSLIEVSDDGVGIPSDELTLAVARYATSKLDSVEGLFAVRTLGFRGEALASIAAVARCEIVSRSEGSLSAGVLRVDGGELRPVEREGAPVGTRVAVRDLFFNTPARRKFLKSETTERRRVVGLVGRYAAAYPQVSFRLTSDRRTLLETSGSGETRQALASVFDPPTARSLLELRSPDEAPVGVDGFVSPPTIHRASRRDLIFFVNGRWVQDPAMSAGVLQAYHGLLMVGRYPLGFLRVTVEPSEVDVNVHPSKAEVRFRKPDSVVGTLQRVVRATLLGQAQPPELEIRRAWPVTSLVDVESPTRHADQQAALPVGPHPAEGRVPLLRCVGQVGSAYLVAEGPDGLYLIDQHAAHERILFERLQADWAAGGPSRQAVLDLAPIELTRAQAEALPELIQPLARIRDRSRTVWGSGGAGPDPAVGAVRPGPGRGHPDCAGRVRRE